MEIGEKKFRKRRVVSQLIAVLAENGVTYKQALEYFEEATIELAELAHTQTIVYKEEDQT
jgi:hypothetical protein